VLQSPEGGFLSVANRRFRVRRSVTPPLPPVSVAPLEKGTVATPANTLPQGSRPRVRSSKFSTLPAATDKIVISRNVLLGLCLTTFAFGILTTLAVDRMHARASEAPANREPDPVVLQTTPIEPAAKSGPAAEAVVVQLPPIAEKAAETSAAKLLAHLPPAAASRVTRPIPAAPVRAAAAPASHKRSAALGGDSSSAGTEAAPDEDFALPAASKKKWVDPFAQ
jgi:hypothetical protein